MFLTDLKTSARPFCSSLARRFAAVRCLLPHLAAVRRAAKHTVPIHALCPPPAAAALIYRRRRRLPPPAGARPAAMAQWGGAIEVAGLPSSASIDELSLLVAQCIDCARHHILL